MSVERDQAMLDVISPNRKKVRQKTSDVVIDYSTRNTKLALVVMPMWSVQFPPYNLARLAGVTKTAGYETDIFDFNVTSYNHSQLENEIDDDLWTTGSWRWQDVEFHDVVLPWFESFWEDQAKVLIDYNPDVIGFTEYVFSERVTHWFVDRIRSKLPDTKFIVGGSNIQSIQDDYSGKTIYDYIVSGEGENAILSVLNKIEAGIEEPKPVIINQVSDQRLNISNLPLPDYCSLDFNQYIIPNAISSEFSRGCVAKCTFCSETHFNKYRQREFTDAFSEVKHFNETRGSQVFYFLDSLVNGNLKELKEFANLIEENELDVMWLGYARHDGRMDLDYLRQLAAGKCIAMNFGCESASQKVLDSIDKKVTVEAMEQNFRDIKEVGIVALTNWISGWPTEEPNDHYQTMQFLWRHRENNLNSISLGYGLMPRPDSIMGQDLSRFNILPHLYCGHWITEDYRVAGPHVLTRIKNIYMMVDKLIVQNPAYNPAMNAKGTPVSKRDALESEHYSLTFHDESCIKEIEWENFDTNIIKIPDNPFAESLMNEVWPILRFFWRTRGGFKFEHRFSPELDFEEFGTVEWISFGNGEYRATYKFEIDADGNWEADFDASYKSVEDPWNFFDFSRQTGRVVDRAKRLAKADDPRSDQDMLDGEQEAQLLNMTEDFSFEYTWKQNGKW